MDIIQEAIAISTEKIVLSSRDDRIRISKKLKEIILGVNEVYKKDQDPKLMDLMKKLTEIKRKADSRLKPRLTP